MWRWVPVLLLMFAIVFVYSVPTRSGLSVTFFDVGQGDAIFVESPTGVQMLVDGGYGRDVLRELGARMPLWDRTIDVVVATHPDKDHIGGLPDVLERYNVQYVIESDVEKDTSVAKLFEKKILEEEAARVTARRGMRLLLGAGAYADILFPDGDVSKSETNAGSIVMRVVYGDTEFMLTGDAPKSVEYRVLKNESNLRSDVLKAGHHGSKTSSAEDFVRTVDPQYVVFSRGCDNRYGHPHPEVVALYQKLKIPTLDTCGEGSVGFFTNGREIQLRRN